MSAGIHVVDFAPPSGFTPHAFRQYVLKIQSRCNLDCDYCYIYHLNDTGWRRQPRLMAVDTVRVTAGRIAEHVSRHSVRHIAVTLHGGEPLLAGKDHIRTCLDLLREALPGVNVHFSVQTNGLLLDDEMASFLVGEQVTVGISLDGDREANDLHRTFRDGRSSYAGVAAAVRRMARPENRRFFGGVLCTIQLAADPMRVWTSILDLGATAIDFLLPHGTWSTPPPGLTPGDGRTPYADWLLPLFDTWFDAPRRPASVRIFEDLVNLLLGGGDSYEVFGLAPVTLVVLETDGSYEQVDSMRAAYEGAAATGLNVFDHPLDALYGSPGVVARQVGLAALSKTCQVCPVVQTCGGGFYPHRYREGSGFTNPSVYCDDLYALITHIERRLSQRLAARGLSLQQIRGRALAGDGLSSAFSVAAAQPGGS